MSSGDGDGPASATESLRQLVEAAQHQVQQRQIEDDKKAASRTALERLSFNYRVAALVGEEVSEALWTNQGSADAVCDELRRLVSLRERMRSDLNHLVDKVEETRALLLTLEVAVVDDEGQAMRGLVEMGDEEDRAQLLRTAEDIANLESEIAESLARSPALQKVRNTADSYEYDGLVLSEAARRSGNAFRRLRKSVNDAYAATIVVVEAVYGDATLKSLNDADYRAELIRRLAAVGGLSTLGEQLLETCATSIDVVRTRCKPGQTNRTPEEAVGHLLKYLRHAVLADWLQPRDASDGHGSGPMTACCHLISRTTRACPPLTIAKYVREGQPAPRRRKRVNTRSRTIKTRRKNRGNQTGFGA
jgi:hypothetical protein